MLNPILRLSLLSLLALVSAHGMLTSPPNRMAGEAYKAACGEQIYNNMASDPYGNIQRLAQIGATQDDFDAATCDLGMCKGFKFEDNNASAIQRFTPGQTVPFKVVIRAPHTGTANVSVINLKTNQMMGQPLRVWSEYASTKTGVDEDQTDFSVTMPTDLPAGMCSQPGVCAVQWWWDSREVDQTYMNCVDFTM